MILTFMDKPLPVYGVYNHLVPNWLNRQANEKLIIQSMHEVANNAKCLEKGPMDQRPLFLDVGANEGYFTLLPIAYGCRAMTFDGQPQCIRKLHLSLALNYHLPGEATIYNNIVMDSAGQTLEVSELTCGGRVSARGENGAFVEPGTRPGGGKIRVSSVVLDDMVPAGQIVEGMHLDTEGVEPLILESGKSLFSEGRVKHLFIEFSPMWYRVAHFANRVESIFTTYLNPNTYECRQMKSGKLAAPIASWAGPLKDPKQSDFYCKSKIHV